MYFDPFTLYIAALFLIKHCIADYFLQDIRVYKTLFGIESIDKTKWSDTGAQVHGLFHGLFTLIVLLIAGIPVISALVIGYIDVVLHMAIDYSKSNLVNDLKLVPKSPHNAVSNDDIDKRVNLYWCVTGIDQLLHGLCYLAYMFIL